MLKRSQSLSAHMHHGARLACAAGLSVALIAGSAVVPSPAFAASAETRSELSRLTGEVNDAAATYASASARADELNAQVSATADEILSIEQERMPEQQKRAADAARNLYKAQESSSSTVARLLTAGSLTDFLTMSKYLTTIQTEQVSALEELNRLEDDLNAKLASMSKAKDEADAARAQAQNALAQAKSAAAKIQQKANAEDAAEAEAARKAAEQAAALAAQEAAKQQASNDAAATTPQPSAPAQKDETQQAAKPKPEQPQQPAGNQQQGTGNAGGTGTGSTGSTGTGSGSTSDQGGWKSGKASHYGTGDGFMGGTTASGAIVTETSMGVAMLNVPLGTKVEIRYRGRSVVAVVNDRGPYAHGRVIDMQPAVARALNFLSVGVDTVEYRFL